MSDYNRVEHLKELHSNRKAITQERGDKAIQRLINAQKSINFNSVASESGWTEYMKKGIKTLLAIVSIILLVLGLFNIIDSDVALSIAVLIGGVSSILNGYSSYVKEKKKESISLSLTGLFIIILSILTLFLRNL